MQSGSNDWDQAKSDIFSEEFLLSRPLLTAIRRTEPTVLLIDETDKADIEIEGLLLEVLSDFAVTVPELGTITASRTPFVVLTSNATRGCPRRSSVVACSCTSTSPTPISSGASCCPGCPNCPSRWPPSWSASSACCAACSSKEAAVGGRDDRLGPHPAGLGMDTIDDATIAATLGVVLKHQSDQQRAAGELRLN